MELERREADKSSRQAHARMQESVGELAVYCERRSRWIRFLQGRIISAGASTGRGVEKEKRLLRRALAKGETLVKTIKVEKEQAR
eukprot:SAG11_NODE_30671_length_298_cov_2.281407_1_plen_84_part_01